MIKFFVFVLIGLLLVGGVLFYAGLDREEVDTFEEIQGKADILKDKIDLYYNIDDPKTYYTRDDNGEFVEVELDG